MRNYDPAVSRSEDFQRDGAVVVRGAFSADDVSLLERGIERNLAEPSERALVASRPDDPGRFFEDFCNWERIPEFEEFIRQSPAAAIAGELMGSQQVRLFHDHLLVKEPGTRQATPWHQDQPYYNVEGTQNVSMWMPVDPVDRESTVEFVAGSHRGPWLMPRTFMDQQAKWFPEGALEDLPDIDENRGDVRDPRLGARAGRRRVLPHAHAARRRRRDAAAARVLGALPRRRRDPRAARLEDLAGVPRPRGRAPRGRADGPSAVPGRLGTCRLRDAKLDALYALPLGEFTAARNALAKELGDPEIRKLAKPSLPAWAVNQLVRREAKLVEELLEHGQALQKQTLKGSVEALRDSQRRERETVRELVKRAEKLLDASERADARARGGDADGRRSVGRGPSRS